MADWITSKSTAARVALIACAILAPITSSADGARANGLLAGEFATTSADDLHQSKMGSVRRRIVIKLRAVNHSAAHFDQVRLELQSNQDTFVHLYAINSSGSVHLWLENVPVIAGEPLTYPTKNLKVSVTLPLGRERIVAVATRERIDGFLGDGTTRRPHLLTESHENFWRTLNAILADLPSPAWGYASLALHSARWDASR